MGMARILIAFLFANQPEQDRRKIRKIERIKEP
jgi:hypothetical protein